MRYKKSRYFIAIALTLAFTMMIPLVSYATFEGSIADFYFFNENLTLTYDSSCTWSTYEDLVNRIIQGPSTEGFIT